MPKREKQYEWRASKIRGTPAMLIGYFTAATAEEAIKAGIAQRNISDPATIAAVGEQGARDRPMIANNETTLAMARRHVIDGRQLVERQRAMVSDLEAMKIDSSDARSILRTFEESLGIFEDHLSRLTQR